MKRFILPLLILLFVGSLFAVESAPSEVVGYVKYDCVAGLNLVALPMDQGYAWASDLGSAYPGMIDVINYWDNQTQTWVAANDLGFMWDGDFELTNGAVLWISALDTMSLYSIGDLPATMPSYDMVVGLNSMMVTLNRSDLTTAEMLGNEVGILDVINYWDNGTQSWVAANDLGFMWDGDFPVQIGMPLWVSAYQAGTWPTRNRSVPLSSSK